MEYMLTDAVIVNGSWLSYPELENKGMPYMFSNFDELGEKILEAFCTAVFSFIGVKRLFIKKRLEGRD